MPRSVSHPCLAAAAAAPFEGPQLENVVIEGLPEVLWPLSTPLPVVGRLLRQRRKQTYMENANRHQRKTSAKQKTLQMTDQTKMH